MSECNVASCELLKLKSDFGLQRSDLEFDDDYREVSARFDGIEPLVIVRDSNVVDRCVRGRLYFRGLYLCDSLENSMYLVPSGIYRLSVTWSPKLKGMYPLIDVPQRSGIRIHKGNYVTDSKGCVLVGWYSDSAATVLRYSTCAFNSLFLNIKNLNLSFIKIY